LALAARRRPRGRARTNRKKPSHADGSVSLPPAIQAVLHVPFRIRVIAGSTVAFANIAPITRGGFGAILGGIVTVANTTTASWASSYQIKRVDVWAAGSGDAGIIEAVAGTAEQALSKESEMLNTIPSNINIPTGGRTFRPRADSYLAMWQVTGVNATDVLLSYWATAGTVIDFEGVFTLWAGFAGSAGSTIASGALGTVVYLSPDGNTAHNLVPQGLPTTH